MKIRDFEEILLGYNDSLERAVFINPLENNKLRAECKAEGMDPEVLADWLIEDISWKI